MLGNEGQAASVVQMLVPGAKANTAAATSAWIDVRAYEGDLVIVSQVGTVTAGTITPTIEHASDGSGTGAATITPNEGGFTAVTTSNDPLTEKRTINANAVLGWIRYLGTIATGPADVAVALLSRPKNV